MAKVTLQDLTSLSNEQSVITAINNNNTAIEVAMEKTLSRNGTSPNSMEANLDMNSNRILNLPDPIFGTEPVTKNYIDDMIFEGGTPPPVNTDLISVRADLIELDVDEEIDHLYITGYYVQGDTPLHLYDKVETEPTHAGKFSTNSGTIWWELNPKQRIHVEFFGAKSYTESELTTLNGDGSIDDTADINSTAFQNAFDYLEIQGGGTAYGLGQFYIFGATGLKYPPGVYFEGSGHGKWMPSFPTEVKSWEGTNLIPKKDGTASYTAQGITSSKLSGGWRTDPDDSNRKFKLTSFMNSDATGTTPATPKSLAVFFSNKYRNKDKGGARRCRIVPWIGTDGISDYSTQTGTDLGADWDIGVLVDTIEGVVFEDVQIRGYWRMAGLAEISTDFYTWSRSECNRFVRCSATGLVGILIRSGQQYLVLDTTATTATIRWDEESIWPSSGQINTISNGYVTYTSLSRDGDNLIFNGLSTDITSSGIIRNPYRGTGFSTGAWYDCEGWALWHHSGTKAEDLGFDKPSTGFEMSGYPMRGLNFFNCSWFGEDVSSPAMHLHDCYDANFFGGKAEIGHVIASPIGSLHEDPTYATGETRNLSLLGFQFTGSITTTLWTPRMQRDLQRQWSPLDDFASDFRLKALDGQHLELHSSSGNQVRVVQSDGELSAQFFDSGSVTLNSGSLTLGSSTQSARINAATGQDIILRENTTSRVEIMNTTGTVRPGADDSQDLGSSGRRWKNSYFSVASTIGSDERSKTEIEDIPDSWLDAWADVEWQRYKLKNSTAIKKDKARWHIGLIAQRIEEVFKKHNLNAFDLGLLCYDKDEDMYSVRYDEALALEAAYIRRELSNLRTK